MIPDRLSGSFAATEAEPAGRSARRRGHRLHPQPLTGLADPGPLNDLLGPIAPEASLEADCWERGAAGEELTGYLLAPLADLGWVVLHDRRLPGSSANIDHLAIGAGRIFVIDTKAWRGELRLLSDGRIWYGHTPFDEVLDRLRWEAGQVALRLARRLDQAVEVQPVLCLHGPRLPTDPLNVGDVVVVTGASLLRSLLGAGLSGQIPDTITVGGTMAAIFPTR